MSNLLDTDFGGDDTDELDDQPNPDESKADESKADDTDDKPEDTDEWTPPSKHEWRQMKRQLTRAVNEAKKAKEQPPATGDELEAAKNAVREEEAHKFKVRLINSEAKAALSHMGAKGDLTKLIRLIDIDDIDLTDSGVDGLDDQLEALKGDFPDLFPDVKRPKGDPRLRGDAADKPPVPAKVSSLDKLAAALRGN